MRTAAKSASHLTRLSVRFVVVVAAVVVSVVVVAAAAFYVSCCSPAFAVNHFGACLAGCAAWRYLELILLKQTVSINTAIMQF